MLKPNLPKLVNNYCRKRLIEAYKYACECDVKAFKPGNVSIYSEGYNKSVNDFILSAQVSSIPITNPLHTLGERIYYAISATRKHVSCNTNLGIVLLCAPLIEAAYQSLYQKKKQNLRDALQTVLNNTSQADAEWVFKAIALANPTGLGKSIHQDIHKNPNVSLLQAMVIAGYRDQIARQYTINFKDIFDFAILKYNAGLAKFGNQLWAITLVFSGFLSKYPDSHIERKYGTKYRNLVFKRMSTVDNALLNTKKPEQLLSMLYNVDRIFKVRRINPGTTADLTVATVFIVTIETTLSI